MPEIYGTGAQLYTEAIKEGETRSLGMTRWQVRVTYRHSARWNGGVPANQSADLKRTNGILNDTDKAGTLKIACLGDSITQGWTASGYENVDIAPHMPPYVELFKTGLQNRYKKAKIELRNFSIAGKTTRWPLFEEDGIVNFQSLQAYKPDLVLVAFGMNDGTGIEPKDFSDNIEAIVKQILAARSRYGNRAGVLHAAKSGDSHKLGRRSADLPLSAIFQVRARTHCRGIPGSGKSGGARGCAVGISASSANQAVSGYNEQQY